MYDAAIGPADSEQYDNQIISLKLP